MLEVKNNNMAARNVSRPGSYKEVNRHSKDRGLEFGVGVFDPGLLPGRPISDQVPRPYKGNKSSHPMVPIGEYKKEGREMRRTENIQRSHSKRTKVA